MGCIIEMSAANRVITISCFVAFVTAGWSMWVSAKATSDSQKIDILFSSVSGNLVFVNKSGYVVNLKCNKTLECAYLIMTQSSNALNVMTYRAIYNFTSDPISESTRYMIDNNYIIIIISAIQMMLSFIIGMLSFVRQTTYL